MELLHDEAKKKSRAAAAVVDEIFFALEEDATPLRKEEERSDDMRFGSDGVCVSNSERRDFFPAFSAAFVCFGQEFCFFFCWRKAKVGTLI